MVFERRDILGWLRMSETHVCGRRWERIDFVFTIKAVREIRRERGAVCCLRRG